MKHAPAVLALGLALFLAAPVAAEPSLYLAAESVARPGTKAALSVRARNDGGHADVHVFHVGQPLALLAELRDVRRAVLEDTPVRAALTAAAAGTKDERYGLVHRTSFPFGVPSSFETATIAIETDRPGLYLVEVDFRGQAAYALVSASNLAAVSKRTATDALVFVADRWTGAPVPDATVRFLDGARELATGTTAADGTWRGALPYVPEARLVVAKGDDVHAAFTEYYPAAVEAPRVYVTTDRPLYRPGDVVAFKGTARVPHDDGTLQPPETREPVSLLVRDGRGDPVTTVVAPLGAHGTFSGEFEVPLGAAQGRWRLEAALLGGRFAAELKVEDFEKPPFEVTVTPLRPQVVGGDDVAVTIRAAFYAGGVVKKAPVNWSIQRLRFDRPSWLDVDPSGYLTPGEAGALDSEVVKQGSGTLDDKGALTVEVPTTKESFDVVYRFAVEVAGPDGRRVAGGGSVAVTTAAFRLAARAEPLVVKDAEPLTVTIGARDYQDRPVRTPVTVSAVLLTTALELPGPARGGDVARTLFEDSVTTDADGVATVSFPPDAAGHIQILVRARDSRGNAVEATAYAWAARGQEALTLRADGLRVVPDKKVYAPGETAKIMVISPVADAHLLVTHEGARLYGHRVSRAAGNALLVELPLVDAHAPNLYVSIATVHDGTVRSTTHQLVVVPVARRLDVAITPDRAEYGARDLARVTLTVRDVAGRPVVAELALAVVDEALYALSPRLAPDILPFFYPRRRNNVGTETTITAPSYGYGVVAERLRKAPPPAKETKAREGAESDEEAGVGYAEASGGAAAPAPSVEMAVRTSAPSAKKADAPGKPAEPAAEARKELKTTILWAPHVLTAEDGTAVVDLRFSDDLTTWRLFAQAATDDTRVGQAETKVRTRQDFLVRLDPPASLTERDVVTLAATVQNLTASEQKASVTLTLEGATVEGPAVRTVTVPAEDAARVDWQVRVTGSAPVKLRVAASAGSLADALEVEAPVRRYGAPESVRKSVQLRPEDASAAVKLTLPRDALAGTGQLAVRVVSGPAAAIRAALPYLIAYPYGCVEQTMSRFVPLLAARSALVRLGAAEGLPPDVDAMVAAGVARLVALQREDGRWGWFGESEWDPLMSAYALYGLALARELGAAVPDDSIGRAVEALGKLPGDEALPFATRAYVLHALTLAAPGPERKAQALALFDTVERARADGFTQAHLILTLLRVERPQEAREAAANLTAVAEMDDELMHWEGGGPLAGDRVETTAWAARALLALDPASADAARALRWLLAAREGGRWRSTRDSAAAVLALVDAIAATPEDTATTQVKVFVDGAPKATVSIDVRDPKATDGLVELPVAKPGTLDVRLEKEGPGLVTADVALTYMTGAKTIPALANGLTVERTYWHLAPPGTAGGRYTRAPLGPTPIAVGDAVLVELRVKTAEDVRYVLLEDPRPTGFRAVRDVRDYPIEGLEAAPPAADHVERRADRTAFFFQGLPRGERVVQYLVRADVAGQLGAMPATAELMYFPGVQGRSSGLALTVR